MFFKVLEWRTAEDMIVKQLTVMSDCLPPLSKFIMGFKLDPWQKRLKNINLYNITLYENDRNIIYFHYN